MKNKKNISTIESCFKAWKGQAPSQLHQLHMSSGSNRQYFQIEHNKERYIGTINQDISENEAFFYYAHFFRQRGIRVPQLYHISPDRRCYIQQDIGQKSLMQSLKTQGEEASILSYYHASVEMLWQMQSRTEGISFAHAYPRPRFDKRAITWDLNYFKYYFLKLQGVPFHENTLEDEFDRLATHIEALSSRPYFMFRDFQARNIHIHRGQPWFIDFQGGRQGPPLYDLVSLLYQSSAQLSPAWQQQLKEHYKELSINHLQYSEQAFEDNFLLMRLIRSLQTLGAYGFRGHIEGKAYFSNSIAPALAKLKVLLQNDSLHCNFSYLCSLLAQLHD